jgi:NTP pyrophosphatase (non-canonical NTP hydrolase)
MTNTLLSEYQQHARDAAIYAPARALHFLFPTLIVEALELYTTALENNDIGMRNHAGDVLWTCAELFTALDEDMGSYDKYASVMMPPGTYRTYIWAILTHSKELNAQWARIVRDRNGNIESYDAPTILLHISEIVKCIDLLARELNVSLRDIAQSNLDKLAERKRRGKLGSTESRV